MLHEKVRQRGWELPQQAVVRDGFAWNWFARSPVFYSHPHSEMLFLICVCCLSCCLPRCFQQGRVQTSRSWNPLKRIHLSVVFHVLGGAFSLCHRGKRVIEKDAGSLLLGAKHPCASVHVSMRACVCACLCVCMPVHF